MNNKDKIKVERRERGPMGHTEKPKDFWAAIKKLFMYAKGYRLFIIIAIILAAFSSVFSIYAPNKLTELTDTITRGITPSINEEVINNIYLDDSISAEDKIKFSSILNEAKESEDNTSIKSYLNDIPESVLEKIKPTMDMDLVKSIALLLALIYILSAIFNLVQSIMMVKVSNNYARDLRSDISKKINRLPLKYYDNNSLGDILSRVTNDVDSINMSMHHSLTSLVSSVTLLLGSLIMMFVTNYILALTAVLSTILGFVFMAFILNISQKYFKARQEGLGALNGFIEEVYTNHNVVRVYNAQKQSKGEFDRLNKGVFNSILKSQFLSGLMNPVMAFFGDAAYVAVCIVGAYLTLKGVITFGVIIAFIVYIRLFTNPLRQIAGGFQQLQSAAASSERVFEFLEAEEMKDESAIKEKLNKKDVKGYIEFDNVKFGYNKDKTIIKDFSMKATPGEKIAIVGPTGAGKTTIVNLLMKFYDIDSGDIKIDGVSINDLTRENVRDLFIMVLQDTWLFNGTIKENIKYNSSASDEEVRKAIKTVGLEHFVSSLPKGINSELSDSDVISAGQRQLLTIARGMIKNSPFLILDEATSNVDTRTEEIISKSMDKLSKGRTSFIIAHRLSTIKNADLILVVNDGNIVEKGSHEELMKKNGFYADLYNSQFSLNGED